MRGIQPIAGMALLALAACAGQPPEPGSTGAQSPKPLLANPQILGTISTTRGTSAQDYTTYAFPSGAFNATSWFGHSEGIYYLNIRAFPNQNPNALTGLLSIIATLPNAPLAGMASNNVTVKILDYGPISDVPRWSSIGQPAHLQITSLLPEIGSSPPAATLTGTVTATLCNLASLGGQPDCVALTGRISTEVQYNYP